MLAHLDPEVLPRLEFPLGDQSKEDTRAEAAVAGLAVANRRDSQEACFLGGDDLRSFLVRRGLERRPGAVVDEHGRELGRHDGFWQFTPGQRRGLGLATGSPTYAVRTHARTNTVVAGRLESLARTRVTARGRLYVPVSRAEAKLRYRSPAVSASIEVRERSFRLLLDEPAYGVAVGQTAAVYEGDAVVGAGVISSAAA